MSAAASRSSGPAVHAPAAVDPWLLGAAATLLGLGTVMVYSATAIRAGGPAYLFRHAVAIGLGSAAALLAYRTSVARWKAVAPWLVAGTWVALLSLFIPGFGREVNGAVRWLRLGPFSFQPAEMAKLAMVMGLAVLFERRGRAQVLVPAVALLAGLCVPVLLQPDLGTVGVLGLTWLGIMFVCGLRWRYLLGLSFLAVAVLWGYVQTHPHAARRIRAFLDPEGHRNDIGYQVWESLVAFGSGGPWGQGLGQGDHKLYYLPESHTDFVFSVVGQELGFVGVLALLGLFGLMGVRIFGLVGRLQGDFERIAVFGIGLWLSVQTLIHMGVGMAMLPAKGLTLPLLSFGRSSLVVTLLALGFVLRVAAETEGAPTSRRKGRT